jgi:uncharacterized protein YhbP (UPF0306 family)
VDPLFDLQDCLRPSVRGDVVTELENLVREYLRAGKLMQLATVSNSQPWQSQLWYAFADDLQTVVFTSNQARRHSRELETNPRVACAVLATELTGLGQKVRGLTFEGIATEASGPNIEATYELYARRWPNVREMFSAAEMSTGSTAMRMYDVRVDGYVLFDEVNYPASPRQELKLHGDIE